MIEAPIELICRICGIPFKKPANEYRRRHKLGHSEFCCSKRCAIVRSNQVSPRKGCPANLVGHKKIVDDLSPFRWFLRTANKRKHKGHCDLTASYLKIVWDKQIGKCPISGWNMLLPTWDMKLQTYWETAGGMRNASLDRVDNSLGYVVGNVRFIALIANYARNCFTDEDVVTFAEAVVRYMGKDQKGGESKCDRS